MSKLETGFCVHALQPQDAKRIAECGGQWIRIDASADLGSAIAVAKSYNLKVLGILGSWMFNRSSKFTLKEWQSNVTKYVSGFAGQVDAWEIWNEPSNVSYPLLDLGLTGPDYAKNMKRIVQFYFSMVKIATPIIRQYSSSAKILLLGGLNLFSGGDRHLALDKEFASQLADINIQRYGDAISIHAYPWINQTTQVVWDNYERSLQFYRSLLNSGLEVWVTETGQPVNAGGETGQAQYLKQALDFFQGRVTNLFWYSLYDNSWEDKQFGLFDNVGRPRLAYEELKNRLVGSAQTLTWKVTVNSFEGTDRVVDLHKVVTIKDPSGTVLFTKTTPFTEYLAQVGWHTVTVENTGEFDHWEGPNGWTSANATFGLNPKEDNVFKIIFKAEKAPGMKVGLTAFGSPSKFNLHSAINEFKSYVENNSKIKLDIRFVQDGNLPAAEIPQYTPKLPEVCYMVTPESLSTASRAKMPAGMKTEIVVYDTQDRVNCYCGLQWGNAVPFICIPYSNSSKWDPGWRTSLAPALVHEFTHALFTILGAKGFQGLPNIDKANKYGYTDQNDPGWHKFRRHCLGLITQEMADALMKD